MIFSEQAKQKYDSFLETYYINGEFDFDNIETNVDEQSPFYLSVLEVVRGYRCNNLDAVDAMKQLLQITYTYLYGQQSSLDKREPFVALLISNSNLEENSLISTIIAVRNYAYQDILEYTVDDEVEMQFMWKY